MTLTGKVALITGAGAGIGLAMTRLFAANGARVLATDSAADRLAVFAHTPEIESIAGDVSRPADCAAMVEAARKRFGGLDILCNVAGIMDRFLPVGEMSDEHWNRVLAVNLTGPMNTTRAALPLMLAARRGVIINVASIGGLAGARGGAAYVTSKHGLIGLTKNVAATYVDAGIRCVAICPGGINTGIPLGGEPSARGYAAIGKVMPSNPGMGEAGDIASLALCLASDEAKFVNGAAIVADGGWMAF